MALVSVPGAVVGKDVVNPFNTPYNLALAQSISTYLFAQQAAGTLTVKNNYLHPGTVPPGNVGEIAVTTPGATYVDLPAGTRSPRSIGAFRDRSPSPAAAACSSATRTPPTGASRQPGPCPSRQATAMI